MGRFIALTATVAIAGGVAGCAGIGVRPLVPPISGVQTAALYSAPERPNSNSSAPVALRIMCNVPDGIVRTIAYQPDQRIDEINLLSDSSGGVSFSGIRASVLSAELQGSVADYYELKLVNVEKRSVSDEEGRAVFARFLGYRGCGSTYLETRKSRAVYQILAVYTGDVQFGVKSNAIFSAELSAKLKALEPAAKIKLSRTFNMSFTGKKVVGAVEIIPR